MTSRARLNPHGRTLSLLALPTAIAIWAVGIGLSRLELSGYGLISGLHPLWFIGIATAVTGMLVAIASRHDSALLTAYVISTLIMIVSTAVLLERNPRFPYIFDSYAYSDQILRTAQIDYRQVYASWPGWHVTMAAAVGASRITPGLLLTWLPLWLSLLSVTALLTLFRRIRLPKPQRGVAIGLAVTAFLAPVYPLPGNVAPLMAIFLVAILLEEYAGSIRMARRRFAVILLFAALVTIHLLTAVSTVVVLLAISALIATVLKRSPGSVALLGVTILVTYLIYVASEVTAELLPQHLSLVLTLDQLFGSIFETTSSAIGGGSVPHLYVVQLRVGYVVVVAVLATLGILVALFKRIRLRQWVLPTAWLAGGIATLGLGPYGGEILARASSVAAPGSLALGSWVVRAGGGFVLVSAIALGGALLAPLHLFGNEVFDYVRPSELAADEVVRERLPPASHLHRPSRTWFGDVGDEPAAAYLIIDGPLYERAFRHIRDYVPATMPHWSYSNGELMIMVTRIPPR